MKPIILITVSLLHGFVINAQQFNVGDQDGSALTDSRLMDFFTDIQNNIDKNKSTLLEKKTKGSPYFDTSFLQGSIKHKDELVSTRLYLLYNAFNDEIEIATSLNQKKAEEAVLKRNDIICTIGDETYLYLAFNEKKQKTQLGYLILIFENKVIKLLKRKKKNYLEETIPRTSLERAFPPRFVEEIQYFMSLNERTPLYLGNDIKEVVKNLPNELKDKAKAKKIVLKKIKDEISLFSALNQLMVN